MQYMQLTMYCCQYWFFNPVNVVLLTHCFGNLSTWNCCFSECVYGIVRLILFSSTNMHHQRFFLNLFSSTNMHHQRFFQNLFISTNMHHQRFFLELVHQYKHASSKNYFRTCLLVPSCIIKDLFKNLFISTNMHHQKLFQNLFISTIMHHQRFF